MSNLKIVVHQDGLVHSECNPLDGALNAVLFDFNPTTNPRVTRIKALCAGLIQEMILIRDAADSNQQQKRNAATAITEIEGAQMRAVKALFAK